MLYCISDKKVKKNFVFFKFAHVENEFFVGLDYLKKKMVSCG